jgi:hypothetical protein
MLISEVYERFRVFIVDVLDESSITVIFANQIAPRPKKPFITMSINQMTDLSLPMRYGIDDLAQQKILYNKSFLVTLESYADELHKSEEMLNKLQNYLATEIAYNAFKGDMAYMKTTLGVSAIPQAISGINESRSILELEFNLTQQVIDKVGLIEHIHIVDIDTGKEIIINK